MANIGHFKTTSNGYEGTIATLLTTKKVSFLANEKKKNASSPDFFIKSGRSDLGVAWHETSNPQDDSEPVAFIRAKFDGPEMDKPFNAALFDNGNDEADLVWNRSKPKS